MDFADVCSFWYVLFHILLVFVDVSSLNGSHTSALDSENLHKNNWSSFLL